MAKVVNQTATIRVSKLVKNSEAADLNILNPEMIENLQTVLDQLIGTDNLVVEIEVEGKTIENKKILHG